MSFGVSWNTNLAGVVIKSSASHLETPLEDVPNVVGLKRDNRKTQASFRCLSCNFAISADVNASVNILAAGRAVVACGDIRPVAV